VLYASLCCCNIVIHLPVLRLHSVLINTHLTDHYHHISRGSSASAYRHLSYLLLLPYLSIVGTDQTIEPPPSSATPTTTTIPATTTTSTTEAHHLGQALSIRQDESRGQGASGTVGP
jgi:hypothetical protein